MKSYLVITASLLALLAHAAPAEEIRDVFHAQGPRVLFDAFYEANRASLDLWSTTSHANGTFEADVYGPSSVIHAFRTSRKLRAEGQGQQPLRFLARAADSTAAAAQEKIDVTKCHERTAGFMDTLGAAQGDLFTESPFHDCWRTSTEVFAFLDKLSALVPQFLTKIASIGKTFEGHDIPVYKISTDADVAKQALVGQSLIHSREWQSGATVFYIISGLLDALRANDPRVVAIFNQYDWYFVPILNIDGYDFTWTSPPSRRLWRKNRRTFAVGEKQFVGVDLNRNFGPTEFFDLAGDTKRPNSEVYPGTGVLSEPESAAVFQFLRALPNKLAGLIDVHMNSQAMLRPFSNQVTEAPEPYQTKLTTLGEAMRLAIEEGSSLTYRNVMGGTGSYLAYGTYKDAVFAECGFAPAFTLELERADGGFITSQTTIRDVGQRTLAAFLAFSDGVGEYWSTG
jgi:hypothetical protein